MLETRALRDLCSGIIDCPHSTPVWTTEGPIVLRNYNVRGGRLDLSNPSFTDEKHFADRIRRAVPEEGDVVITREAPMGEVAKIPNGLRCCLGQRMVLLKPDRTKVDPGYLLYALQSEPIQRQIAWSEGSGATVSNLRIPHLAALRMNIPAVQEQRRIASILGSLDDKIELNRQMCATLEEMARAIFRSWFVDFDPVRAKIKAKAKAEGREPEPARSEFPDAFMESSNGQIPRGWSVSRLLDVAPISTAAVNPSATPAKVFEYFSIPAFDEGRRPIAELGANIKSSKYAVSQQAVLVSKLNPNTPRVWLTELRSDSAICSTEFMQFVVRDLKYRPFLYLWMLMPEIQEQIGQRVTGSTGSRQRAQPRQIESLPIITPPDRLVNRFARLVEPLLAGVARLAEESERLSSLRDLLLPRLLEGKMNL